MEPHYFKNATAFNDNQKTYIFKNQASKYNYYLKKEVNVGMDNISSI